MNERELLQTELSYADGEGLSWFMKHEILAAMGTLPARLFLPVLNRHGETRV